MLDEDFLVSLEYSIAIALANAGEKYWCDGVYLPDSPDDFSPEKASDTGKINLRAAIPKGQYEEKEFWFDLILKFGKQSLKKYTGGKSLADCIPDTSNADWIELDEENKIIEVQLK
jgi:hypothetical protein